MRDAFMSVLRSSVIRQRSRMPLINHWHLTRLITVVILMRPWLPRFFSAIDDSEETKPSSSAVTRAAVAAVRAPKNSKAW